MFLSLKTEKKSTASQKPRQSARIARGVSLPAVTLAERAIQKPCMADVPNQLENSAGEEANVKIPFGHVHAGHLTEKLSS